MPSKRIVAIAVIGVVAVAVAMLLLYQGSSQTSISLPRELPDGTPAVKLLTGRDAVETVKSIHWSPGRIGVVDAAIAVYSSGARLWAAVTSSDACSLAEAMASKMKMYEGELPYTQPVEHEINGVKVYLSLDKRNGFLHAFWCKDRTIYWAELPPSQAILLRSIVEELG